MCGCIYLYAHMCSYMYGCVVVYCGVASGPVERVYFSAPIVTVRGKEANLTAVVWPSHTRTLTFFWWFDNSSEVRSFLLLRPLLFHAFFFFLVFSILSLLSSCPCIVVYKSATLQSFHTNHVKCARAVSFWRIQLGWLVIFIYHADCVHCSTPSLYSMSRAACAQSSIFS